MLKNIIITSEIGTTIVIAVNIILVRLNRNNKQNADVFMILTVIRVVSEIVLTEILKNSMAIISRGFSKPLVSKGSVKGRKSSGIESAQSFRKTNGKSSH